MAQVEDQVRNVGTLVGAVMPVATVRRLDELAAANDRSRSAEIRRAVHLYLDHEAQAVA